MLPLDSIVCGDNVTVMQTFPDACIDSIVCDPPYGLSFMGKKWDYDVPSVEQWAECLRVLKPGGYLLSFAGTRTMHRMAVNIEDAGFEIRDTIAWVYGSGFPKSLDVSKAIDKAAGAEREVVGKAKRAQARSEGWDRPWMQEQMKAAGNTVAEYDITSPSTDAAKQWAGWGTALKPAFEPITVARKPLIGTVAENVQRYGTGAINVDGCRVGEENTLRQCNAGTGNRENWRTGNEAGTHGSIQGRFPANLIHDGSEEVLGLFPETKSGGSGGVRKNGGGWKQTSEYIIPANPMPCDSGSAARFFYCAKASKKDRGDGNNHPTVKPNGLMRYLCRLVTQPGGIVLDPWAGSGSTLVAAQIEHFRYIGIEVNPDYVESANRRLEQQLLPFESEAS